MTVDNELIVGILTIVVVFSLAGWHVCGRVSYKIGKECAREYWANLPDRMRGETDPNYLPRYIEQAGDSMRHGFNDELQRLAREYRS